MRTTVILTLMFSSIFFPMVLLAQEFPKTQVYLLDLRAEQGKYVVSNPELISGDNNGYNNQPSFSRNNQTVYYSSERNGQTDIVSYYIPTAFTNYLSGTDQASEFSPQLPPGGRFVSAVQLEKNGNQGLWGYTGPNEKVLPLIRTGKIGYYTWLTPNSIAAMVLEDTTYAGATNTLQVINVRRGSKIEISHDVGRSLQIIPGTKKLSYISNLEEYPTIMTYNPSGSKPVKISKVFSKSQDFCWINNNSVFMGVNDRLYIKNVRKKGSEWKEIPTFHELGFTGVTRIAISPNKKKMAVVVTGRN